ncbi:MAG: MMPL family transporter, partial [Cytophagales bacterium]|nr:MMPL family transporter [Cytophagales bacterium]
MNIQKINQWFEKRASTIIKARWLIIVLFMVIVGTSFLGLKELVIESSWDDYFLEGDPMLVKTDEFKEIFGNDNFVAVLTECDDIFTHESLKLLRELSNELLDSISYADKITSLTDIEFMVGTEYGMQIEQIVPEQIPTDKESLEAIRNKAYSKPNVARKLVSSDGKLSWLLLKLRTFPEDSVWKKTSHLSPEYQTGEEAEKIISKEKYNGISPRATGMPYLNYKKQEYFGKESIRVMGLALLIAIIVLVFATKSVRGVLVPLVTSVSSVIIIYGTLGYVGYAIDSGMTSIPVLLSFAISIAYNIHIFSFFRKQLELHGKRKMAVTESIKEMGWPVLFSALTTMAALLTFLAIPMKPLRFVGIATASCVLLTFLIVILIMPALLSFGKDKKPSEVVIEKGGRWLDLKLARLGGTVLSRPSFIVSGALVLTVLLLFGITKVESAFDVEKTMGRRIPYVKNLLEICESELGSLYSYDLLVEFSEDGEAKQPENLKKLEEIARYVEDFELTKRTTSILDIIKDLNRTLNENDKAYYRIPDDANQIAQMLLLYENAGGTESEYWMDYDYKRLRLMVELATYNSGEAERELQDIQEKAGELFPGAKVTAVGNLPQFTTMMQYVVNGQIKSFVFAVVIIAVLLMIVFGSVRIGLIGLIPNIAPAIAVGGVMGWLDIPLDMMTATIIPMILGLAVDDTIHFINHGHLEFSRTGNYKASVVRSFRIVGVALTLSTLVISANFLVYTTSTALQFVNLGMLAVIGM